MLSSQDTIMVVLMDSKMISLGLCNMIELKHFRHSYIKYSTSNAACVYKKYIQYENQLSNNGFSLKHQSCPWGLGDEDDVQLKETRGSLEWEFGDLKIWKSNKSKKQPKKTWWIMIEIYQFGGYNERWFYKGPLIHHVWGNYTLTSCLPAVCRQPFICINVKLCGELQELKTCQGQTAVANWFGDILPHSYKYANIIVPSSRSSSRVITNGWLVINIGAWDYTKNYLWKASLFERSPKIGLTVTSNTHRPIARVLCGWFTALSSTMEVSLWFDRVNQMHSYSWKTMEDSVRNHQNMGDTVLLPLVVNKPAFYRTFVW